MFHHFTDSKYITLIFQMYTNTLLCVCYNSCVYYNSVSATTANIFGVFLWVVVTKQINKQMLQSFSGYFVCNSDCYISEKHLKPPYRSSLFGGLEWTMVFLAKWGTSNVSSGSPSGWLEMSCLAQKQSKF